MNRSNLLRPLKKEEEKGFNNTFQGETFLLKGHLRTQVHLVLGCSLTVVPIILCVCHTQEAALIYGSD